jgi:hypothetical protein
MQIRPPNQFENLSLAEQDAFGARVTGNALKDFRAALERFRSWTVDPTSLLAEDDAATSLFQQMSFELRHVLTSAADHLAVVDRFVTDGTLPPFAPYTLIRSAIEGCCYAIWLQHGGTLDKRVFRLLQQQWDQRVLVNAYTTAVGAHTQELTDWLLAVLNETKNRRGKLKQRDVTKSPSSTTDTFLEVDKIVAISAGLNGLSTWRACSGVTHGNQNFSAGLTRSSHSNGPQASARAAEPTTNLAALSLMLTPAVTFFCFVVDLVIENSKPRPGLQPFGPITGGPTRPTTTTNPFHRATG